MEERQGGDSKDKREEEVGDDGDKEWQREETLKDTSSSDFTNMCQVKQSHADVS